MSEITATAIPRIRQPQVSGWEVAAGISDQAEVEEMVISENITSIDQEAFQNLIDYVQEKCIGQRRPVSFNELKETDEFKQLLAECDLEGLEFTDYKNFLNWQNLQITQQALEEGQQNLEELNKAKEDFYNEYSKKIGKDLNTILTEYENQIQEVLNNYISDFSLNLSMVIDGSKYLNDDDLETYSKIIFEVLNNEGESQYTQDEIKNALTNKDANLEKIYENFINNSNSSSNLLGNAIKRYYPAMSSYIESLNQQYNEQLENSELTIEEIKYILNSYDQTINQIEQQNKANEQLENDLYYAFIMGTEDYKNFKTPGEEGNVSVNIVGEGEFKYYWTPECDLSPIEYINYVLEKENITMEEFLNGKYTEFYIEAGNASNSGDYLHSDMLQLINLIKASEYDENLLKMYNYIYYTQGLDAANEYIYNTESNVNETLAQVNVQEMLESMELNKEYTVMINGEERNISFIVNDGKLAIKGLGDGVGNFFTGLMSWLNTNEHKTVEEWEQYYFLLSIMSTEDKIANGLIDENGKSTSPYIDFTKNYYNVGGEGVYQISQSIGNMIPSMLLSTINPTLGTVSMGISAGGNSFRDAVTSGYDLTDSIIYAVMSGASEAVLERLLGSIPGLGKTDETFAPNISTWLKSCYSEGKEEFIQEGFDILLKGVLFDEEIDLAEAIKQMGVAGVYGAITGGIMNGVAFPFKAANLDANLETIAEANNGTLTNAQIAEMFGTTEAYVEEFMARRKLNKDSSTTAVDTTTNPQTSTSEGASEISETAPETENIPTAEQTSNSTGETDTNISITEVEQLQEKYDLTDTQIAEIKATAYTIENAEEIAIILYQAKSHPTSMSGIDAEQANLMLTLIENNEINSFFTEDGFINDEIFKSEYEKIKNFSDETIREARKCVINEGDSLLKVCEIMTEYEMSGTEIKNEVSKIVKNSTMSEEEAINYLYQTRELVDTTINSTPEVVKKIHELTSEYCPTTKELNDWLIDFREKSQNAWKDSEGKTAWPPDAGNFPGSKIENVTVKQGTKADRAANADYSATGGRFVAVSNGMNIEEIKEGFKSGILKDGRSMDPNGDTSCIVQYEATKDINNEAIQQAFINADPTTQKEVVSYMLMNLTDDDINIRFSQQALQALFMHFGVDNTEDLLSVIEFSAEAYKKVNASATDYAAKKYVIDEATNYLFNSITIQQESFDFSVSYGIAAPWFDESGGAEQYEFVISCDLLEKLGFLSVVAKNF